MRTDKTTQPSGEPGFPLTIEFEDGSTKVLHSHNDAPKGIPFRILPDGEWLVVASL